MNRLQNIKAVLWDLDGVLIDSAPLHFTAWQELFRDLGKSFSYKDFITTFGLRNDTILQRNLGLLTPEEMERLGQKKEELFRTQLRLSAVPFPGAVKAVNELHRIKIKQAVVSSAPRENIDLALKGMGVDNIFDTIVSEEDTKRGKPDPQGFLLAAERLGMDSTQCVVVEDAPGGVIAGLSAGMKVIALTSSHSGEDLEKADLVVDSFEDERVLGFILNSRANTY